MVSRSRRSWPRHPQGGAQGTVDPPASGVIVTCGRHRVLQAGYKSEAPYILFYMAPGRGMKGPGAVEWAVWRYLGPVSDAAFVDSYPPIPAGCVTHGSHYVPVRSLLVAIDRMRPRPGRDWPRIAVVDLTE